MTDPQNPPQPDFTPPFQPPQYAQPAQEPQYAQPDPSQYAQNPYVDPAGQYGAPQPPKKGLSTGAIVGIVAGSVVLVLLVVVGGLYAVGSLVTNSVAGPLSTGGSVNKSSGSPADVVEEYLNALADGDAKTARNLVGETSSNSLLSDEVLKKSLELAPMTNISVDKDSIQEDSYDATISATFDLGDETFTRDFSVYDSYSDGWAIQDGLVSVSLSAFKGLGPTLNGVKTSESYVEMFPGVYEIGLSVDAFTVDGDSNTFAFTDDTTYSDNEDLKPVLTKEAHKTFTNLVTASLKECLALTTLSTPCGNDVDAKVVDGTTLADGDVKRTLTAEGAAELKEMEPRTDWEVPTSVSAFLSVDIDVSLTNGDADRSRWLYGGRLLNPTVDFADEKPSVTWKK